MIPCWQTSLCYIGGRGARPLVSPESTGGTLPKLAHQKSQSNRNSISFHHLWPPPGSPRSKFSLLDKTSSSQRQMFLSGTGWGNWLQISWWDMQSSKCSYTHSNQPPSFSFKANRNIWSSWQSTSAHRTNWGAIWVIKPRSLRSLTASSTPLSRAPVNVTPVPGGSGSGPPWWSICREGKLLASQAV